MWKLILLILAGLYTLNPYDILPDFMVGWGWLDDLIVWILLWRFLATRKSKLARKHRSYEHSGGRFKGSGQEGQAGQGPSNSHDPYAEDGAPWDPHRILGIEHNASAEEIKHAYRELANKYHPDKLEYLGDEFKTLAEKRFKKIQQAYQELTGKGG